MAIVLKNAAEIESLAAANRLLHRVLDRLNRCALPGVAPIDIAARFQAAVHEAGAVCAFQGYQRTADALPFPASCCICVNSVLTHGVPDHRYFRAGDLVTIDAGLSLNGFFADAARTWCIEPCPPASRALAEAARSLCHVAIDRCQPGRQWGAVRAACLRHAESLNVFIVPDVAGHGIGRRLHEQPSLPLALAKDSEVDRLILRPGMTLAIEPVVTVAPVTLVRSRDGFGLETVDGSPGAHHEECIVIESGGPRRLH